MRKILPVAIALGSQLLASAASAQEKKIKRSDLPPAVEKTVAAQSTGATIRGFSTEKEKGQTLYEAEMTVSGHSKDILMAADVPSSKSRNRLRSTLSPRKSRRDCRPRPAKGRF